MRFAGFSALALLLASSSAIPTKRQALIDSIGGSSLDDVIAEIKNNGNINLLGDLIEVAVDALSTEASAVAECFNPSASNALGSGSVGAGASAGTGVGVGGSGTSSPSASAVASELSNLLSSVASAATAGPDAAAAASSALNFLSTASPAASVAPEISSLLSSIADNTAAIPTGAASSLAGAASGAPSQLSSFLGSLATEVAAAPNAAGQAAANAASSALGFLSTANPAASVAPAISSFLSSIAADPSATIPANVASSLANAASSAAANLPGVTAGAGVGVGIGGSVGGSSNPALSSLASSLLSDPAVTGAPALSSAIGGLTNPGASVNPALSSALSSILANPSVSLPTGVVSSLVSAISSAANNGGGVASPATNTRASGSSAASSSSTPIACPFSSKSTYSVLGSQFTRYCNQFYGGNVLNLGNAVLKRQTGGSLNSCASICAPEARCLGTQYNPSTGSCTFYSSLTNGVTRNGVQFAVRSSAASSISPPVSAGVTASAGVSAGIPSGALSSLASEAATATGALGSELSSLISQLSTATAVNTGALSSLISELPTATSIPGGLISSIVDPAFTSRRSSVPGLSAVPSQVSSIVGGLSSAASLGSSALSSLASQITGLPTEILPTNVASSLASEISGISTAVDPSSVLSSIASQITDPASSILSGASSGIASITSGLLPPSVTPSAVTTSCGGGLVDLCATIGLVDGVSVNLGLGGIGGATPTTYSGASGLYTATSTQCSGLVCLAVGLGPSVTATLGALQTDGTILDLGAGVGGAVSGITSGLSLPTTLPGGDVITSTSTSCSGAVCLAIGVGPSATVTLGALNTDGSIINIGAGITPAITAASTPTTLPDGDVITSTSASCSGLVCLAIGLGPSATVTLGALNTDGSIVSLGAAVGGSATVTTPPTTAGASVSIPDVTSLSTSCSDAVCVTLGLGPLATVTLGAIGSDGLVGASVGALATPTTVSGAEITAVSTTCDSLVCLSLGVGPLATVTLGLLGADGLVGASVGVGGAATTPAVTAPAVVSTSTVVNGNTITAISQSCGVGGVVDACVSLGLGPLGTITLGADALNPSGGVVSAGVSATILPGVSLTNGQVVPTTTVVDGTTITAVSASCTGAAVDACVTVGLGSLGTIALNAGVLPTSGGLASLSAGASVAGAGATITAPAVIPTTTVVNGATITAVSQSCGVGGVIDACVSLGLGPLGTITLGADALNPSGGVVSAGVSATLLPSLTNGEVVSTSMVTNGNTITAVSKTCSGALLNLCATVGLGNLATVTLNAGVLQTSGAVASASLGADVLKREATTLATVVRK
ncbi:hypothetical protein KCU65_g9463, partial [Aureobasidium melanogenum]